MFTYLTDNFCYLQNEKNKKKVHHAITIIIWVQPAY